ncbi:High-affnity carbon uptake protein Hat/HatR [Minicystis rosea]|nr:High-affnity carbon uptake protein Hat/HatR [Minicystis rosea]
MHGARPLWSLTLPDYAPDVRFSPDGRSLAAATVAGPVVVLDPWSGTERFRTDGHEGGALSLAFCVMHPLVATGGADGEVAIHRAGTGVLRARTSLGRGWVERLAWSPDGAVLAASMGRSVCFLSTDGTVRGRFDGHPSTVTGLAWHVHQGAFVTSAYGVVTLLSPDDPEPRTQHYFRTSLLTVHPSPDGRFVASGTQDPMVHVWDLDDDSNEVNLTGYAGKVAVLAWCPAFPLLATAAGAGVVTWDFAGGDPFRRPPIELSLGTTGRITSLEFLRTGELLAGTDAGVVWLLELGRYGEELARSVFARVTGAVCALVPSPDGRALAVVATGGGISLWSLVDGE